jgi:nicotinamidase-related amidase
MNTETIHDEISADGPMILDPDGDGCALVVVDVQERLLPHIHGHEEVLRRSVQAVQIAAHLGVPVIALEQYRRGLGETVAALRQVFETAGADAPIEKMSFSAFGEPSFVQKLEDLAVETLIVCGIEAHVCVLQTALDAVTRGFQVLLLAEATGSRNPRHATEAWERMRQDGVRLGSVEMFAFEALRSAEHPAFQKIRRVIM